MTGPATPDVQSDANDDNQHLSSLSSELPSPNLVDPPREADLTINEPDETEGIGDLEKVAKDETEKNVDDEKAEHAGNEVIHRDENGDAGNLATNSTPDEQASNTRQVSIAPSSNIDQLDRELFGKTPTTAESRQFDFDGLFESNSAHGNVMPQETVDIPTKESSVEALDGVGNTVLGISTSIDEDIVPMPEIPDMEAVLLSGLEDYANTDLDLAIVSNLPTSTQPQINDLQEVVGLAIVGSDSQAEVRLPQDDEIVQVQGDLTGDGYDGPAHTSGEPSFDDIFSDANLEAGDVAELEIGGGSTEFDDAFFNLQ